VTTALAGRGKVKRNGRGATSVSLHGQIRAFGFGECSMIWTVALVSGTWQ